MKNRRIITAGALLLSVAFTTSGVALAIEKEKPGHGGGGGSRPQPRPEPPHSSPAPRPQPAPQPRPQPPRPQPVPQPRPQPAPQPAPKPGYGNKPAPRPQPVPQPAPVPVPAPAPKPGYGTQPRPPQQGPIAAPRPSAPMPMPKPGSNIGVRPGVPVNQIQPPRVIAHEQPSHLARPATQHNMNNSNVLANRYRQTNPVYVSRVNNYGNIYYNQYNTIIVNRTVIINNYYSQPTYRYYYSGYFRHGFYGGYYYPVRPCYTINNYFWYPTIYWLYVGTWDDDYYRVWYPNYRYRVEPFRYATVYYPSDTVRDLGIEVSGMGEFEQYNFRQGLTNVSSVIERQISERLVSSYALQANDIVINHYENLNDKAIVIEGFADEDNMHLAFKALIDLKNPSQTLVFMPMDQYPTQNDLTALQIINQRIINLGGNPYAADDEPVNWQN